MNQLKWVAGLGLAMGLAVLPALAQEAAKKEELKIKSASDRTGSHAEYVAETVRQLVHDYLIENELRVTAVSSGKQMLEVIGREAIE